MVHMISVDAQSHRCGNCKAIFGPAGHVQSTRPAGKTGERMVLPAVIRTNTLLSLIHNMLNLSFNHYITVAYLSTCKVNHHTGHFLSRGKPPQLLSGYEIRPGLASHAVVEIRVEHLVIICPNTLDLEWSFARLCLSQDNSCPSWIQIQVGCAYNIVYIYEVWKSRVKLVSKEKREKHSYTMH